MKILRIITNIIARLLLPITVGLLLIFITLQVTIANQNNIKRWLDNSGVYASLAEEIRTKVTSDLQAEIEPFNQAGLITQNEFEAALKSQLSAQQIQDIGETFIDDLYTALERQQDMQELTINTTPIEQGMANELLLLVEQKVQELPDCPNTQQAQNDLTCIPRGVPRETIAQQIGLALTQNFFTDDQQDIAISQTQEDETPLWHNTQRIYQILTPAIITLSLIAFVLSAIVILLSANKRSAYTYISIVLIVFGVFGVIASLIAKEVTPTIASNTTQLAPQDFTASIELTVQSLIHHAANRTLFLNIIVLVVGLGILTGSWYKKRQPKPKASHMTIN